MRKAEILNDLQLENANWEALLAEIGEARMTESGVAGDRSIKDIVAHLTGWRRRSVVRLQAAGRGEPPPPPPWPARLQTDDEINAWIYATNHDRPLADVLNDSRQVIIDLIEAVRALPDGPMDPRRWGFDWPEDAAFNGAAFFDHFHEEHEPDMRAWLDRVKSAA